MTTAGLDRRPASLRDVSRGRSAKRKGPHFVEPTVSAVETVLDNGTFGKRSDTKRAMVTLAEGDEIDLFEV